MANKIRIKRRAAGGNAGAPASLENAELAFNEQDDTLYYGKGTGGAGGTATSVISIAGPGSFATLSTDQTISGNKTFSGTTIVATPTANSHAATKEYVDTAVSGATVSSEQVQDVVGAQFVTNGSHTGISASYDDAGDGAIDLSLTNTTVTAASYGSSSAVATFTVDAKGRLTAASNSTISIASTAVTDFTEAAQDAAAALLTSGTHSGIAATYDDANAKVNLNVADFTITLGGDLTGSVTVTDLANATLTATIAADSVALGTDTSGNYVGSIAGGTLVTVSNTGVEGGTFTVGLSTVTAGRVLLGNATGVVTATEITGDVTVTSGGVTAIASNTIVNADINTAAAIDHSKLASATAGRVLLGNATNVVTATTVTGDVTIDSDGVTAIGSGVIVNADINNSAAIALSKLASGTSAQVIVANATGVPTYVSLSGDITVSNTGVVSIAADSVALGTDTTGNYVGSVAAGTGISVSNTGVEGGTFTITNGGVTSLAGTANEVAVSASNGAVTLSLPANVTISNNLVVTGNLTVQGGTTTLNTETLVVEDKNITLANVATPTDITADGAGISILGTTTKTLNWVDATDAWTSSEHLNLLSGKEFKINGTTVLSGTNLDNVTIDGGTF